MTTHSEASKAENTQDHKPFAGSTSLFGAFSVFFVLTSFLFFFLIFYHATLTVESQLIHDKATLYKTAMLSRLPLAEKMSSENIVKIQNFISDLKTQDSQLGTVMIFTKDGLITYSSTLGLIGDHITDHWQESLTQDPLTPEILSERDLSLFYPIPTTDGLYLALTFKKESFLTLLSGNQWVFIVVGLGSFILGIFLLSRHIMKLRGFDFKQDPLLLAFEKCKSTAQAELDELSKDLKDYETL